MVRWVICRTSQDQLLDTLENTQDKLLWHATLEDVMEKVRLCVPAAVGFRLDRVVGRATECSR
jgi:hypothetical protein